MEKNPTITLLRISILGILMLGGCALLIQRVTGNTWFNDNTPRVYCFESELEGAITEVLVIRPNAGFVFYSLNDMGKGPACTGRWKIINDTLILNSDLVSPPNIFAKDERKDQTPSSRLVINAINSNNWDITFCEIKIWDGKSDSLTCFLDVNDTCFVIPSDFEMNYLKVSDLSTYSSGWISIQDPGCRHVFLGLNIPNVLTDCRHAHYLNLHEKAYLWKQDRVEAQRENDDSRIYSMLNEDDPRYKNLLLISEEVADLYSISLER